MRKKIVLIAVLLALCAAILCQGSRLLQNEALATKFVDDFSQYWAAGRLNLAGNNPYSESEVYALQKTLQPDKDRPTLMWNPPWTLAIAMPFSMLPYVTARLLWLAVHLTIILGSIVWLWKFYGGGSPHWAWILALVIGFPPTVNAIGEGQISAFVLLGLVGFLHFDRRGSDFLAGACAALALIKPHLLLMFWIALAIRSFHRRSPATLFGATVSIAIASAIAIAFNPSVFHEYLAAVRQTPPFYWVPPTLGAALRMSIGWPQTWLSFVPSLVGAILVAVHCHRNRNDWQWKRQLPALLLVSVIVMAYGWVFDYVVLLIPVIYSVHGVARRAKSVKAFALATLVATCIFGFFITAHNSTLVADYAPGSDTAIVRSVALAAPNSFWFVLIPPILAVTFVLIQRSPDLSSSFEAAASP